MARQLFAVRPHAGAHRVALRVGISVLVPLLVVVAIGRPEWSTYAAFGAFTSLYGRNRVHLSRLRMQATLGVLLTVSVALGVLVGSLDARSWWSVPIAAVLAGGGAILSDLQDWHPPGPLFLVFAFSVTASIPSRVSEIPLAVAVSAAASVFAVLVGTVGWLRRPMPTAPDLGRRSLGTLWHRRVVQRHLLRYLPAVVLAGSTATVMGIGHPYWAMVSAVVPMAAPDLVGQLIRAAHRLLGTFLGLGLSAVLLALDARGLALVLLIVALQVLAELFVGRNYGLALIFVTPLALLMGEIAVPHPAAELLADRGTETLIGVFFAIALTVLVRDRSAYPSR